ncbi:EamA family transporter [Chitinophaga flava]|uniref:EamA family transporter n=1 Tax=Chitinophaga flava TaxID=2259036 RepID=A0A365XUJ2_9BACT|nr:DMT family transporter [Chitinophaga flava]RBL89788.1 EamA family transporter [Chitinophaga flava]
MNRLKGAFFVVMGAASYGVLATFVKIAGQQGYTTGAVTFSQFLAGFLFLFLLQFFLPRRKQAVPLPLSEKIRLIAGGTSLGLTSTFYYLSVQYLPVSVCIILLMQTIWMGIVYESIRKRAMPAWSRLLAIVIVLGGTILATGVYESHFIPDWKGVLFGMLAAVSYTVAMGVSNSLALEQPVIRKSMYLVLGGLLAILIFWNRQIVVDFRPDIFWKWGLFLATFGTILPPVLFSKGFPKVGIGTGSILSAVEIPVSIGCACIFLQEPVSTLQCLGVALIISGIIAANLKPGKS